jgi:hypothetical protein
MTFTLGQSAPTRGHVIDQQENAFVSKATAVYPVSDLNAPTNVAIEENASHLSTSQRELIGYTQLLGMR